MAKRQVVVYSYTCDVGGEEIPDNTDGGSRKVSWEGSDYIVDVCSSHAGELAEILNRLKTFIVAGQRQDGRRTRRSGAVPTASSTRRRRAASAKSGPRAKRSDGDFSAVRTWARENGHSVNTRGRIPAAVMSAYEEAQQAPAEAPAAEAAPAPKKRSGRARKAAAA